jgi:repressor of nif and glnA expression
MGEQRRAILGVLEGSDEPLGPKVIHEKLNERGAQMSEGAVREMLSQMAKAGQVTNLGRGQYVHPAKAIAPDNADTLT